MRILFFAVAAILLAGCQSKQLSEMSYSEIKELAVAIEKRCAEQGHPRGSKEFIPCTRQETEREDATRQANLRRRIAMGESFTQASQNFHQQSMSRRMMNCTSTGFGNRISTTCY